MTISFMVRVAIFSGIMQSLDLGLLAVPVGNIGLVHMYM